MKDFRQGLEKLRAFHNAELLADARCEVIDVQAPAFLQQQHRERTEGVEAMGLAGTHIEDRPVFIPATPVEVRQCVQPPAGRGSVFRDEQGSNGRVSGEPGNALHDISV